MKKVLFIDRDGTLIFEPADDPQIDSLEKLEYIPGAFTWLAKIAKTNEYELVMANMNRKLAPSVETMIVFASPEFYYVSSNTVKEVAMNGGSVKDLVPPLVEDALRLKFAANVKDLRERQKEKK